VTDTQPDKPIIGLAGGVGAGKSTVADELGRMGCAVVDADAIGHEVLREPDVREAALSRWGDRVLDVDREVDRSALGEIVFSDPTEMEALNRLLHPRIRERALERIQRALQNPSVPAVVLDAPVLFEAGWDDLCTVCVFVDSPAGQRRRRVAEARGWDEQEWRRREKTQIPLDKKARSCQYKVENSSSVSHLRERARGLFREIVESAGRS
jgi:dephospho-CoA kinase